MTLHLLYLRHKMHCIWHLNPRFMTTQPSLHYISLLYLISNWLYLIALPLCLCHNSQIINHITPIVCMITQAQYVWYHTNTYDITSNLYDITPWYELHTHCIHVITPRIHVIASTAAELWLTVYWEYHICNMCDLKPTICRTSYEFYVTSQQLVKTSQDYIHDTTATLFMTSPQLYMTSHTLYLWPHSPVTMEKHLLCFSPYTQSIFTWWMNDNTTTLSVMIPKVSVQSNPLAWWHHSQCTYEISPTARMTP